MAIIYNSTKYTLRPDTQQVINNACANLGIDEIYVGVGNNGTLFDMYDDDENYLFSVNTEGNVIFEK